LGTIGVPALEIGDEVGGPDNRTELMLQPRLEPGEACILVEVCLGEQSVLAPGQRKVEVGECLVPALAVENAAELESFVIGGR
jgi:hypothetical protein